jgi:ribosomal protein L18E
MPDATLRLTCRKLHPASENKKATYTRLVLLRWALSKIKEPRVKVVKVVSQSESWYIKR